MSPFTPPERSEPETAEGVSHVVATPSFTGDVQQIDEAEHAPANAHQCPYCNSWYARPDHLKRHMQSHDNARMHRCRRCSRGFNRKDLLDRHQIVHERSPTPMSRARMRRYRTSKACEQCASAKTKCWGGLPCNRCQRRGDTCLFGSIQQQVSEPSSMTASQNPVPEPQSPRPSLVQGSDEADMPQSGSTASQSRDLLHADGRTTSPSLRAQHWDGLGEESSDWLFHDTLILQNDDDLGLWSDVNFCSAQSVQHTFPDLDAMLDPAPSSSQHDVERDLDAYVRVEHSPTNLEPLASNKPWSLSGHKAFQRSPWLWAPRRTESGSFEESPRLTDAEALILSSSPVAVEVARFPQCAFKNCGTSVRDALLLLVQRHTDSAVNVASFPSLMSLDLLLQRFLYQQMTSNCPFIHVPSFDPETCRTELLAAMIASIAASSANRVISQMGLALQEKTRIALAKAFYHDDRLVRTVEATQTAILWIETGLWSGTRRKMEVAESAANNVPTMTRRAGALPRNCPQDSGIPFSENDTGVTLRRHWLKWVETESFKRSACRAFMGDVQGSIAYLRPPCFYSADIDFELPAAQDIWEARNPVEWKTIFMSKPPPQTNDNFLSLLDVVDDPMLLASAGVCYDLKLSALIALHCMWIQVASFLDSRALFRGERAPRRRASSLSWLEAQRQDLYQKLKQTQFILNQLLLSSAETRMICEFLSMSLYASPVEIQQAAGRFGEEKSQSTVPNLHSWIQSERHRYSIWHAGQVLRAAENMHPNCIHGFYAIPVYQACLTLLTASFMVNATVPSPTDRRWQGNCEISLTQLALQSQGRSLPPISTPVIILNGSENVDPEGYLVTGLGIPALRVKDEIDLLSKAGTISSTMESIFRGNHGTTNPLPPLLDELLALVKDLSTATWCT